MSPTEVVELFKKHKPIHPTEVRELGIKLRYLGEGAFRKVYAIGNLPMVVKFPKELEYYAIEHAVHEIKMLKKIKRLKEFRGLRPLVPHVYYTDTKAGIVVMERCYKIKHKPAGVGSLMRALVSVYSNGSVDDSDLYSSNLAENKYGDYKIIDLGIL